jgi:hypothetical protein
MHVEHVEVTIQPVPIVMVQYMDIKCTTNVVYVVEMEPAAHLVQMHWHVITMKMQPTGKHALTPYQENIAAIVEQPIVHLENSVQDLIHRRKIAQTDGRQVVQVPNPSWIVLSKRE